MTKVFYYNNNETFNHKTKHTKKHSIFMHICYNKFKGLLTYPAHGRDIIRIINAYQVTYTTVDFVWPPFIFFTFEY